MAVGADGEAVLPAEDARAAARGQDDLGLDAAGWADRLGRGRQGGIGALQRELPARQRGPGVRVAPQVVPDRRSGAFAVGVGVAGAVVAGVSSSPQPAKTTRGQRKDQSKSTHGTWSGTKGLSAKGGVHDSMSGSSGSAPSTWSGWMSLSS